MNNKLIDINHANAYSEVLEILRFIPIQEYNKIPKEKLEIFERFSNKEYKFIYNPKNSLDENNVSNITKTIIAILFRDYWATENQRQKILNKQNFDKKNIQEEKYNPDNLFKKNKEKENIEKNIQNQNLAMVEYKEPLLKRIINKIKSLFNRD